MEDVPVGLPAAARFASPDDDVFSGVQRAAIRCRGSEGANVKGPVADFFDFTYVNADPVAPGTEDAFPRACDRRTTANRRSARFWNPASMWEDLFRAERYSSLARDAGSAVGSVDFDQPLRDR